MAVAANQGPSPNPAPVLSLVARSGPWLLLDGLVVMTVVVCLGAYLYFFEHSREWAWRALGYGWVPIGLWALSLLLFLRYQPRALLRFWRRFGIAAAGVALVLCAMSYAIPTRGLLEDIGYSGLWGVALGGPSLLPLGLIKVLAILALVPLVFYPRSTGPVYSQVLSRLWHWAGVAARYLWIGIARASSSLRNGVQRISDSAARGRAARAGARAARDAADAGSGERPPKETSAPGPAPAVGAPGRTAAAVPEEKGPPPWIVPAESGDNGADSEQGWRLPSIETMAEPEPVGASQEEFQDMAREVEQALSDHGVRVEVSGITAGPRVVQFGLSPGWVPRKSSTEGAERSRVKVQSILTREKDLALALRTPYLRIEAPVPGEALVGLEVPVPTPHQGAPPGRDGNAQVPQAPRQGGPACRHGAGYRRRTRRPGPRRAPPHAHRRRHRQRQERPDQLHHRLLPANHDPRSAPTAHGGPQACRADSL